MNSTEAQAIEDLNKQLGQGRVLNRKQRRYIASINRRNAKKASKQPVISLDEMLEVLKPTEETNRDPNWVNTLCERCGYFFVYDGDGQVQGNCKCGQNIPSDGELLGSPELFKDEMLKAAQDPSGLPEMIPWDGEVGEEHTSKLTDAEFVMVSWIY